MSRWGLMFFGDLIQVLKALWYLYSYVLFSKEGQNNIGKPVWDALIGTVYEDGTKIPTQKEVAPEVSEFNK